MEVTGILDERFVLAAGRIKEIAAATEDENEIIKTYIPFFRETAAYVQLLLEEWEVQRKDDFRKLPIEELRSRNRRLYQDILPENYEKSFANPAYASSLYGVEMGRILSFLYAELHSGIEMVYEQKKEELLIRMELFLKYIRHLSALLQKEAKPHPMKKYSRLYIGLSVIIPKQKQQAASEVSWMGRRISFCVL